MVCRITKDGKMAVCGGARRGDYYFTKNMRYALRSDSLWYDPVIVATRKKYGRIDLFRARVRKKLGFMPRRFETWWRKRVIPELEATKEA